MNKKRNTLIVCVALIISFLTYGFLLKSNQGKLELNLNTGETRVIKSYFFFTYSNKKSATIFSNYLKPVSSQKDNWVEITSINRFKYVPSIIKMLEEVKSLGEPDSNMTIHVKKIFDLLQENHSNVAEEYVAEIWNEWMDKAITPTPTDINKTNK